MNITLISVVLFNAKFYVNLLIFHYDDHILIHVVEWHILNQTLFIWGSIV